MFNFFKKRSRAKAPEIDSATLENLIRQQKNILLVAMTGWCDACRMQKPLIHDLADHHQESNFVIALVNIDHETIIRDNYAVRSIPTILVFRQGELVFRHAGIMSRKQLEQLVTRFILE